MFRCPQDCANNPDLGVYLLTADGTLVSNNVITWGQSGVILDSTNHARVLDKLISNIDTLDRIDFFASLSTSRADLIRGNIFSDISLATHSSAVKATGEDTTITGNTINDAYAGVLFGPSNVVGSNTYFNTNITEQSW